MPRLSASLKNFALAALGALFYFLAMPSALCAAGLWWALPLGLILLFTSGVKHFWLWLLIGFGLHLGLYSWLLNVSGWGWVGLSLVAAGFWVLPLWAWGSLSRGGNSITVFSRFCVAALWVVVEGLRGWLGWGWLPLASGVVGCKPMLMWARLGGEGLVGFLLVLFALTVSAAFLEKNPKQKILRGREAFLFVLMLAFGGVLLGALPSNYQGPTPSPSRTGPGGENNSGLRPMTPESKIVSQSNPPVERAMTLEYGEQSLSANDLQEKLRTRTISIGFVQPNAPMSQTKTTAELVADVETLKKLSNTLIPQHPDVILWPEQATPWAANSDATMRAWLGGGADFLGCPIVSGMLWHEAAKLPTAALGTSAHDDAGSYFNAVGLVLPRTGLTPVAYKKRRLVPFGEYIPFSQYGWARSLTPIVDSFAAGREAVILEIPVERKTITSTIADAEKVPLKNLRLLPLICYEDTFNFLISEPRKSPKNISSVSGENKNGDENSFDAIGVFINDGWFGSGAAPQHATHSVLRAVEWGVPVLRASNGGLTGIVTPEGRVNYLPAGKATSGVMDLHLEKIETPYSQTAYGWRWGFVVIFLTTLAAMILQNTRRRPD